MGEDNLSRTFEELRKEREIYGYSEELLTELENGNLNYLYEISLDDRNNKFFMEPLLFAVKNSERNNYTYEVYTFYGPGLQKIDLEIAEIIAEDRPDILKGTAVLADPASVIYLAQTYPEVVIYISEDLKNDGEFIEDLCKTGNREAVAYAIDGCDMAKVLQDNPDLANNPDFMKEAVKEDASILKYADENLKNNYEFIKQASKENYEVVGYIINNNEEFGLEAIKGAKDTTRKLTIEDSMKKINEEAKTSDDKRYQKVVNKIEEKGENNIYAVRWTTAMAAQSDRVTPEYFKKVFDDSTLAMLQIQKDLTVEGKEKISSDSIQNLVTPHILNKLKEKAIVQGLEVDQDLEDKIQEYTEFFNGYREKLKEYKKLKLEKINEQKKEKDNLKITPEQIEEKTNDARICEINNTTKDIREEYIRQTEEKEVKKYDRGIDE